MLLPTNLVSLLSNIKYANYFEGDANLGFCSALTAEQPSILVAAGAYVAEDSYFSTDLSMPSYNVENSESLVKKQASPEEARKKEPAPKRAPPKPKVETEAQRLAREEKEAKNAIREEKFAREKYEREMAILKRKQADQEKAALAKAERAAMQQKRLEYKQ